MHFGKLLAKLRTDRGLTQERLSELAGMSTPSIQRGERSATCPFRKSNATDVLHALESIAPLSAGDAESFLTLAGLEALARQAGRRLGELRAAADQARGELDSASAAISTRDEPDATTAHDFVHALLEEAGATRVLAALEGLAAAWQIDLPPRVRRDAAAKHGAWIFHAPPAGEARAKGKPRGDR